MSNQTITQADAERILQAEPNATHRAVQAAITALNTANHINNGIWQANMAHRLPDLNAEMLAFNQRMRGLGQAENYILATEAEQHFSGRLREAENLQEVEAKAHFERNVQRRLEETRLAQQREWREKHGKLLDDVCRDLISEIETARHDISTSLTSADLQAICDKLSSNLRAAAIAVDNIEIQ